MWFFIYVSVTSNSYIMINTLIVVTGLFLFQQPLSIYYYDFKESYLNESIDMVINYPSADAVLIADFVEFTALDVKFKQCSRIMLIVCNNVSTLIGKELPAT